MKHITIESKQDAFARNGGSIFIADNAGFAGSVYKRILISITNSRLKLQQGQY
ncbi:MAG TPA: hypothetical protein VH396_18945 [Chitinophagaceae bacterium]|jgi:hypothetical protein